MRIDQPAFHATTFAKNRQRLCDHQIADEFFATVVAQARLRRYRSPDHFSVDEALLEAWYSPSPIVMPNARLTTPSISPATGTLAA